MPIEYTIGDATYPHANGQRLLPHICNDAGGRGKGYVNAISKRWPEPERDYRAWYRGDVQQPFKLGQVRFIQVNESTTIANVIAQHGYRSAHNPCPLSYAHFEEALATIAIWVQAHKASIHCPRIGCGLAGGDWLKVEVLLLKHLPTAMCTIYDLESQ